jgi:hypothetical protein
MFTMGECYTMISFHHSRQVYYFNKAYETIAYLVLCIIFHKIEARPQPCQSCLPWQPCYLLVLPIGFLYRFTVQFCSTLMRFDALHHGKSRSNIGFRRHATCCSEIFKPFKSCYSRKLEFLEKACMVLPNVRYNSCHGSCILSVQTADPFRNISIYI